MFSSKTRHILQIVRGLLVAVIVTLGLSPQVEGAGLVSVAASNYFGVNIADPEVAPWNGQQFPVLSDYQSLATKGVTYTRLATAWESWQNSLLGSLDPTYSTSVETAIDNGCAVSPKIGTILDVHNFGYYAQHAQWISTVGYAGNGGNPGTGVNVLGDGTLTKASLVDLWTRIATLLKGRPCLIGYDLMNEPAGGIISTNLLTQPNYFVGGDWFTDNSPVLTQLAEGTNPLGPRYGPAWSMTSGTGTPDLGETLTWSNVPYTVSFEGWTNSGTESVSPQIRGAGASKTLTTTPQFFSNTVTPAAGSGPMRFTFNQAATGHTINIANFQVQLGSVATAYDPSPWFAYAQAAINAIRAVDPTIPIYVEGFEPRASQWPIQNGDNAALAGTGLIHSAHQYFDGPQGVGGPGTYVGSYASYNIDSLSGAQAIDVFATWAAVHVVDTFLGEFNIPGNDTNWQNLQNNAVTEARVKKLHSTMWYYGANHNDGDPLNVATTPNDPRLLNMMAR